MLTSKDEVLTTGDRAVGSGERSVFSFRCCVNRHEPHDHRADWNGEHYVSHCQHCRKPIRRVTRGKWVADKEAGVFLESLLIQGH